MNLPQPPEGVLDPKIPWSRINPNSRLWIILKARLTGRPTEGEHYSSYVNISEADADRLIANMKKDPRGYPSLDQESGTPLQWMERQQKYQEWLVEDYLENPFREQTNKKIEEAAIEARLNEIQEQRKENKKPVSPAPVVTTQEDDEKQEEQEEKDTIEEVTNLTDEIDADADKEDTQNESSETIDSLTKSLESIKKYLSSSVSVATATTNATTNILTNVDAIKGIFSSQLTQTKDQFDSEQIQAQEKSLEQTNISGQSIKANSTFDPIQKESGDGGDANKLLNPKTSKFIIDFLKSPVGIGIIGGVVLAVAGIYFRKSQDQQKEQKWKDAERGADLIKQGGKSVMANTPTGVAQLTQTETPWWDFGAHLQNFRRNTLGYNESSGGFLNTPYPAMSEGGMYPSTPMPSLAGGGTFPDGLYDNPTRAKLGPGQAVIPLNRNYGKKILGVKKMGGVDIMQQPFADVLQQPIIAIGSSVVAFAGQFIRSLGPLGGFFAPFITGLLTPMAAVLGVSNSVIDSLIGGPAYAASIDAKRQQNVFAAIWSSLMKTFGFNFGGTTEEEKNKNKNNTSESFSGGAGDWAPLLELIRKAEGSWESIAGKNPIKGLTDWTIQKVADSAPSYAGAYQLDPKSIISWAKDVGVNPDDKFTPENQNKIAVGLIEGRAQGKKWRSKEISDQKFGNNLSTIWAGLPVLSSINGKERGSSYYAGTSWNKANVTAEEIEGSFKKISAESGINAAQGNPMDAFTLTGPASGYEVPGVGTMHGKEALIRYDQGFTVLPIENKKFSMEKDPLKTIMRWGEILNGSTVKKPGYETGGRGLSTRGVQAGFTGMNKEGFDAIMGGDKFRLGGFKPQILGRGAYSAPTMKGAQRYAGTSGSLGGRQTAGGVIKSIVPGGARRINFLEPQAAVAPGTFDKGKLLADKLLSGKYGNSPLANKLRNQLLSGSASVGSDILKIGRLGGKLLGAVGPILDLAFPDPVGSFDQISGPNAYYNAPGYKASVTSPRAAAGVKSKPIIVTMPVSSASAPVAQVSGVGSAPDTIKPLRQPAQTAAHIMERSNARRFH
jgi:hypothetical protein